MENIERIITNIVGTVRTEFLGDDKYMVAPMVMIVGNRVLKGNAGPLFYPSEEIAKHPDLWNNKPIVVNHPMLAGKHVTACDPRVFAEHEIGLIKNATYEDGKLKAEAWLREDRLKKVSMGVYNSLMEGRMVEVSTGMFAEYEVRNGSNGGEEYYAIVQNIRPDHLAVLPEDEGACSIKDGAGLLRVNASKKEMDFIINHLSVVDDAVSFGNAEYETFKYEDKDVTYQQAYRIDNSTGHPVMVGIPSIVNEASVDTDNTKVVEDVPTETMKGEMIMDELINQIISNTAFEESDREFLSGLSEEQLKKVVPVANEKDAGEEEEEEAKPAEPVKEEAAPVTNNAPEAPKPRAPKTVEEFLANSVPGEFRGVLVHALKRHNEEKSQKIEQLVANERCTFTKEQLGAMNIDELDALVNLAGPVENKEDDFAVPAYFGQAPIGNKASKETPLSLPKPVWED